MWSWVRFAPARGGCGAVWRVVVLCGAGRGEVVLSVEGEIGFVLRRRRAQARRGAADWHGVLQFLIEGTLWGDAGRADCGHSYAVDV